MRKKMEKNTRIGSWIEFGTIKSGGGDITKTTKNSKQIMIIHLIMQFLKRRKIVQKGVGM